MKACLLTHLRRQVRVRAEYYAFFSEEFKRCYINEAWESILSHLITWRQIYRLKNVFLMHWYKMIDINKAIRYANKLMR